MAETDAHDARQLGTVAETPRLAAEFDRSSNDGLDPAALTVGSNRRVWWRCSKGHSWAARIGTRVRSGSGCPVCSGRLVSPDTCLAATHPKVAAWWHPTANGALTPAQVVAGSRRRVWWQCEHGHEWTSTVLVRTRDPRCPQCSGWVLAPETSLAATDEVLAAQWHPTANGAVNPTGVSPRSVLRAWWLCPDCGNEWAARVRDRVVRGSGCPACAYATRRRTSDPLTTTHPELAAQWHPIRNQPAAPDGVTYGSGRLVWWQCEHGHEWEATVSQRSRGTGCPSCSGWRLTEHTTLAVTRPDLAAQWHPTRNGELTPSQVAGGSPRRVWWVCPDCGHEWRTSVHNRAIGTGCPDCARRDAPIPRRPDQRTTRDGPRPGGQEMSHNLGGGPA